jgi:mevalonate kinase
MNEGLGEAAGKIILLGEHSAVYGKPVLAAGLEKGARARARRAEGRTLRVRPWNVTFDEGHDSPPARAFRALLEASGFEGGVEVDAELSIASGSGLGSSAALGVAVLRALDALGQHTARTYDESLDASLAWERVFHGNPSGVDSALALRGGLFRFTKGEPLAAVMPRRPLTLVVANSGEACSTASTVASVARQHARDPARLDKHFEAMATLVRNAELALRAGDSKALGQLMDMNQSLLAALMVSTPALEELIAKAREAGALGAKLTGGGGGGCMIALVDGEEARTRVLEALGETAFSVTVGQERDS